MPTFTIPPISNLIVNATATCYLTQVLFYLNGPFEVFERLRSFVGVYHAPDGSRAASNELAKMLMCLWCVAFWVGLLMAWGNPMLACAYAAVAVLYGRVIHGHYVV